MDNKEIILDGLSPKQREAAETAGCDILVRAGAGSGKTSTLVARFLLLLNENPDWHPADITAVTFTRKAAREMQSRIRKKMMDLAFLPGNEPKKTFWLERLNEMDSANIGTIHSLCGRILRAHPAEAGLDPEFSVLDDNSAAMLIRQIAEETVSQISSDPKYEKLLDFYDGSRLTKILTEMLKSHGKTDAAISVQSMKTVPYLFEKINNLLRQPNYSETIAEYREMTMDPDFDKFAGNLADSIRGLVAAYDKGMELLEMNCHPADAAGAVYSAFDGWSFNKGSTKIRANAKQFRDDLELDLPFLKKDKDNPSRDIAWYKEFWGQYDAAEDSLRKLWPHVRGSYMNYLDSAQTIDFDMMESLTVDLLRGHPDIRDSWTARIKALLVDEFQDTNDSQTELFSLLNPSRDRLFAVGDKKQSIYGFRGTNVALFDRRGAEVKRSGGKDILLDITYRTKPELLYPMGHLLERVMEDGSLADKGYYAAYEPMKTPDESLEKRNMLLKEQPFVEILLNGAQDKKDDPDGMLTGSILAQRLIEMISGGLLRTWNDAVILCRTANDFGQFERALEAFRIPYVTVAGKGYYDRPEIRDILNILRAAENPDDNAVFTGFLMSPCIGFSAEMTAYLYRYANKGGLKLSFRQALDDEDFCFEEEEKQRILGRARSILGELIRIIGQVPLDEVMEKAFRLTGIRTMLACDSGDRAWLNLDKLLPTARESGLTSVSEFLEYLDGIKETGAREGEAPSDDNGAVRIMTIHQAKGLEFPVTIIADNVFRTHDPLYSVDSNGALVFSSSPAHLRCDDAKKMASERDRAEWLRLFYVAATRAKNRLILCGKTPKMDGVKDTWLKRGLADLPEEWLQPGEYTGPAWGTDGQAVMVRCVSEMPAVPSDIGVAAGAEETDNDDFTLLDPICVQEKSTRDSEHTAALTVGRLVHKGIELWRFPEGEKKDPVLEAAFQKILMRTDRLTPDEQRSVLDKAELLLSRFRQSDEYSLIESAEDRRHEIPFSFISGSYPVNGVIDLLMRDGSGYTIIDFKTDELKSEENLTHVYHDHSIQLGKYRRALRVTLGEDPRCMICFLDFCGKVKLIPVGKDEPAGADDGMAWEELPQADAEPDGFWFEDDTGFSESVAQDF